MVNRRHPTVSPLLTRNHRAMQLWLTSPIDAPKLIARFGTVRVRVVSYGRKQIARVRIDECLDRRRDLESRRRDARTPT